MASPTNVSTPMEFVSAVEAGVLDIVVTNHLDFTLLPLPLKAFISCDDGCDSPVGGINATRSIRGSCEGASTADLPDLSEPPLVPLRPGQCILLSQEDMLPVQSPEIWLDNLYTRALYRNVPLNATRDNAFIAMVAVPALEGKIDLMRDGLATRYLTRMTVQGDNLGSTVGVFGDESVYIEDCHFLHLGGSQRSNCNNCIASVIAQNTAVSIKDSRFEQIYTAPGSRYILVESAGSVRVENCTFSDNATDPFQMRAGTYFYSDDPTLEIIDRNSRTAPSPLEEVPDPPVNPRLAFLSRDDQWFAELRNLLTGEPLPPSDVAPAPSPESIFAEETFADAPSSSMDPMVPELVATDISSTDREAPSPSPSLGDSGPSTPLVVGISGAVIFACLCVLAGLFLWRRRRSKHHLTLSEPGFTRYALTDKTSNSIRSGSYLPSHLSSVPVGPPSSYGSIPQHLSSSYGSIPRHPSSVSSQPRLPLGMQPSMPPRFGQTTHWDTFCATRDPSQPSGTRTMSPGQPPPKDAHISDRLEFLHSQLDTFGASSVLLKRFSLLGYSHRRQGGQGLVAFARGVHDQLDYAIKFFLVQESFEAERSLYETKALGALLPQIEAEYNPAEEDTQLLDARGTPLPPFLVMEKGESLSDWTARSLPDLFQGIAVLVHVATRLRDMHAAGYVHRDVKPGNIMLLPRKNSWTVIDFGCTARTGEPAPLSFTVQYAPPEVIDAYLAKHKSIVATEAMDAWAMGVVAFELLTGGSAFSFVNGSQQIMRQLQGEEDLPWEGEKNIDARRKLGIFRQPILSLLRRDPVERTTLAQFCSSCQQVFTSTSTPSGRLPP